MLRRTFQLAFFIACTSIIAAQDNYYPMSLQGKKDKDLKNELHLLIINHEVIPYGSYQGATWTVFRKSDVRPDGSIWDMYSDNVRYFPQSGSNREMNIEHSAPKSWWGEGSNSRDFKYDASFDLHHLVPSDADANMAKSNYILGEVVNDVTFDNGVSIVGNAKVGSNYVNAFEPADEYKGDFARMYFYIVTCYQGKDQHGNNYKWRSDGLKMFQNDNYPTLTTYGKELLMKWHRQDPVSDKEIDRNNAVYSFQRNRNPFIDHPEMAEYIWGNLAGQDFYFGGSVHLNGISSDQVFTFPFTQVGQESRQVINIQGDGFLSDINISTDNENFQPDRTKVSPDELAQGISIAITFSPQAPGIAESTLRINGGGLANAVSAPLKGYAIPERLDRIYPINLRSVYKTTDSKVPLRLNQENNGGSTWEGDGVSRENDAYVFDPSVGKGKHTLRWNNGNNKGTLIITVE